MSALSKNESSSPGGKGRAWRQSQWYRSLLYVLIVALLGAIYLLLRSPAGGARFGLDLPSLALPGTPAAPAASGVPVERSPSADEAARTQDVPPESTAGVGTRPRDVARLGGDGRASGAEVASQGRSEVDTLRQRLQELTGDGGSGSAGALPPGSMPAPADGAAALPEREPESATLGTDERYRVDLPPHDREAFAERQRQLEALRTQTLADLRSVSPADAEGMLEVIRRMSDGIRAQGLPQIVDMPKMEALLLGSKRLNQLNAALVAEMGRGAAARPEEMARLANEIRAVQATIPSTVYDLEAVGKLMRGELP